MKSEKLGIAALAAVLAVLTGGASALAELQIIESNVPGLRVGQRIADIDEMQLPAGGRVKVIVLPAKETKVFYGPDLNRGQMKYSPFGGTRGISIQDMPGN